MSIAQYGYKFVGQAFFPLFPLLIRLFGSSVFLGLVVSNALFLLALFGLYKLIRLDYGEKIARGAIIILLLFPTSFYFASLYTESFFLALVVWSFYYARREKWLFSGILGGLASATRIIGILLLPVLLIEGFLKDKKITVKHLPLIIICVGILSYMFYLKRASGDYLAFLHALPTFGEQRSGFWVFLPQVIYRYIFKILPSLNYSYFQGVFSAWLEFIVSTFFLILCVISFFKLRLGYSIYLTLGYIIPTLSGSFSSMPRYVIVLFPGFILLSIYLQKVRKVYKILIYLLLFGSLALASALFFRGYWIA